MSINSPSNKGGKKPSQSVCLHIDKIKYKHWSTLLSHRQVSQQTQNNKHEKHYYTGLDKEVEVDRGKIHRYHLCYSGVYKGIMENFK